MMRPVGHTCATPIWAQNVETPGLNLETGTCVDKNFVGQTPHICWAPTKGGEIIM